MVNNNMNKKIKLKEDVMEFFEGSPQTQRAYDILSNQLDDNQLKEIDWEMLVLALQAKVSNKSIAECVEESSEGGQMIKILDETLKNMGY